MNAPASSLQALDAARHPGATCGAARGVASMRGSVTAELAVVLPAITALLAVLLLSASAGMLQLRLEEGARAGARALARGDSSAQVLSIVLRVSGEDASVSLGRSGGYATVTVQGHAGGALSGLVPWTQTAQASARVESAAPQARVDRAPGPQAAAVTHAVPHEKAGPHDPTVHKTSLWRWVRAPGCPLRTGLCTTAATVWKGGSHGQG